jgi:hypothetical protein
MTNRPTLHGAQLDAIARVALVSVIDMVERAGGFPDDILATAFIVAAIAARSTGGEGGAVTVMRDMCREVIEDLVDQGCLRGPVQ